MSQIKTKVITECFHICEILEKTNQSIVTVSMSAVVCCLKKDKQESFGDGRNILHFDCEVVTKCIHLSNSLNYSLKMRPFYHMYINLKKVLLLMTLR